jgi:hypothetical protein
VIYNPRSSGQLDERGLFMKEPLSVNKMNLKSLLQYYSEIKSADVTLNLDDLQTEINQGKSKVDTIPVVKNDLEGIQFPISMENNTVLTGNEIKTAYYEHKTEIYGDSQGTPQDLNEDTPKRDYHKMAPDSSRPQLVKRSTENPKLSSSEIIFNNKSSKDFIHKGVHIEQITAQEKEKKSTNFIKF